MLQGHIWGGGGNAGSNHNPNISDGMIESSCLFKHYAMKAYGRMKVQLHALTWERDERSASSYGCLAPKEKSLSNSCIGRRVNPSVGVDVAVNDNKY